MDKDKQIQFLKDSHDAMRELAYQTGVRDEREACAKVCESTITPNIDWWNDACQHCATAIRARGEK